jgi:hypothetical protein
MSVWLPVSTPPSTPTYATNEQVYEPPGAIVGRLQVVLTIFEFTELVMSP